MVRQAHHGVWRRGSSPLQIASSAAASSQRQFACISGPGHQARERGILGVRVLRMASRGTRPRGADSSPAFGVLKNDNNPYPEHLCALMMTGYNS